MPRPAVLLITDFPFWHLGDGQRMRLLALVWVLGQRVDLSLMYLGVADTRDLDRLRALRVRADFHALVAPCARAAQRQAVTSLCKSRAFDACVIERLRLDFVREALPPGVRTVLDTHDLLSEHSSSRAARDLPYSGYPFEQELAALQAYDLVLMIQATEYERVAARLGRQALLAPHPVQFPRRPVRPQALAIGLVGRAYEANLHGLDWYADQVWPLRAVQGATLHLFGRIGDAWRPGACPEFVRHGFVPDFNQVWGAVDVAINPVRWGSGLKIKTVEALGNGLPLVTTTQGASGLVGADGVLFLLADAPAAFAEACGRLLGDAALRERLGAAAHAYARQHFSAQACFRELID